MIHAIEFSADAERHLGELTARQRSAILDATETQLTWEPDRPSRARKLLRPNPVSVWELRAGDLRVFYNVEADATVLVVAIGRKRGNRLLLDGQEFVL